MFNMFEFKIPTYKEWKVQLEKLIEEQPEQAKKYQEQVQKFWKDFFEDVFKIKWVTFVNVAFLKADARTLIVLMLKKSLIQKY